MFWADPISIRDYQVLGEAITFDATYKTNKYHLILGMFCDVNHHKSTIIFGVGFMSKENRSSFVWLFEQFMRCMEKPLLMIITNQDSTIKATICEIFPQSFHRFCKWNIMNKMGDKIGRVYRDKVAMEEFYSFLNHSQSIEEFDNRWSMWIEENGLEDNNWLIDMFHLRHSWCPVYMRDYFFSRMSTT